MFTIQIIILVLVALIFLAMVLIFIGIRLLPVMITGIVRKELRKIMSTEFNRLRAAVFAQTSVIASAVAFQEGLVEQLRAAAAEGPDAVKALADQVEANTGALAKAMATNTPASNEVPADEGGTGDDADNVDPDTVELEEPADEGDGSGDGDEAGDGSDGDGGEGSGGGES